MNKTQIEQLTAVQDTIERAVRLAKQFKEGKITHDEMVMEMVEVIVKLKIELV